MDSLCKLCVDCNDLRVSHILPSFVGKYLKDTSATGFLTAVDQEGKPVRVQDLSKTKLLCGRCESILNEAETYFANKIFYPFKKGELKTIPVDERLARFAVSVSLRAFWVMQSVEHPLAQKWKDELGALETEWRNFLLCQAGFVKGKNSHHIILCTEHLLAPGLSTCPNLFLTVLRSSAYYIFEQSEKAYLFANLAGVQIVSMISPAEFPVSRGTQVYPDQTFGTVTPAGIGWGGYFQNLLELNDKLEGAWSRRSAAQTKMIHRSIGKDLKRANNSEDTRILIMQQLLRDSLRESPE